MPNVEIVVEASLGDSLVKLDLAEHAVKDLGDSGESTSHQLRDFNASMDDTTIASHRAGSAIHDTEKLIRDAEQAITGASDALGGGGGGGGGLSGALAFMNSGWQDAAAAIGGFLPTLGTMTALAGAAVVAVIALADAIGTLVAIAASLVAPLTLITGLLGGLAAAFGYVAIQAIKNHVSMDQVHTDLQKLHIAQQTYNEDLKKYGANSTTTENALLRLHAAQQKVHDDQLSVAIGVGNLSEKFHNLVHNLTVDFEPILIRVVGGLSQLLRYLNSVSHMNLNDAFRSLSTRGVQMLNQFVQSIAHVVAQPIRLAFQIAFGTGKGGNEFASAVANMWHQLTDFLFGYSRTHILRIDGRAIKISQQHVDGIFQPLIDWFNRHDFTKQGIKIGHELLRGLKPLAGPIGQFIVHVFEDAMKTAVVGMLQAINPFAEGTKQKVRALNDWISQALVSAATSAWSKIESLARGHIDGIKSAAIVLAAVFAGPVVNSVMQVVNAILTIISNIQTAIGYAHDLANALSAVSLGHSNSTAGRTGQGGNSPGAPNFRQGGNVVQHNTFHLTGSGSHAAFSRQVREIGRELARQQHILAGGA